MAEASRTHWRPNVQKFSLNLLDDLKPRSYTRDLEWGIPVPLDGWRDRPDKAIYVWFDAVVGYLSASIEWAAAHRRPGRVARRGGRTRTRRGYYFMGKDNIVFHAEIWPAMLFGYSGIGAKGGTPGSLGALDRPYEVVSSEFLTMEGTKFSSSRNVVIYVGDMLSRYDADALRYYLAVAGPENQDTDFTWSEFLRRNNDELVAGWGNLVNRTISMTAKNLGVDPGAGRADRRRPRAARAVARRVRHGRRRCSRGRGRRRRSPRRWRGRRGEQVPVGHGAVEAEERPTPTRMASVLHVALQVVDDVKTLLTPFLPSSSSKVHARARRHRRLGRACPSWSRSTSRPRRARRTTPC